MLINNSSRPSEAGTDIQAQYTAALRDGAGRGTETLFERFRDSEKARHSFI